MRRTSESNPPTACSGLDHIGLAAAVAHEVRRLLTPAKAYAELALRQPGLSEQASRSLGSTIAAAAACDEAIDCLVGIGSGVQECKVHDVVNQVTERTPSVLFEGDPQATAAISPVALEMVLANLASNAERASNPGSAIHVRVTSRSTGNNSFTLISIDDAGRGMNLIERASALQPFVSHSASAGMGLAICRHLIEAAGGSIDIQSSEGVGTCVSIKLPATDAFAAKRAA